MEAFYALICIVILGVFPRQLTNLICFGRHRDEIKVQSKIAYWAIFSFWFALFGLLCLIMGSDAKITPLLDKILCGFHDGGFVEGFSNDAEEGTVTVIYYTRKPITQKLLFDMLKADYYMYENYALQEIELKKNDAGKWDLTVNGMTLGSVDYKRTFWAKEIYFKWDTEKLEERDRELWQKNLTLPDEY